MNMIVKVLVTSHKLCLYVRIVLSKLFIVYYNTWSPRFTYPFVLQLNMNFLLQCVHTYIMFVTFVLFMYRHTKCVRARDKDFNAAEDTTGRWTILQCIMFTFIKCVRSLHHLVITWNVSESARHICMWLISIKWTVRNRESQHWQWTLLCLMNSALICYVYISKTGQFQTSSISDSLTNN